MYKPLKSTNVNVGRVFKRIAQNSAVSGVTVDRGDKVKCVSVARTYPWKVTLKHMKTGEMFVVSYSTLVRSYIACEKDIAEEVQSTVSLPSVVKRTVDMLLQDRDVFEYVRKETGANEVAALRMELTEQKRKWEELRGLLIGGESIGD